MGKIRIIALSDPERHALEAGFRQGKNHGYRMRCKAILLKSAGQSSQAVGQLVQMHPITVNTWLSRYQAAGLAGLEIKPGRGRKLVLDPDKDTAQVRQAVQAERQRLGQAKLMLEQQLNKQFSLKTLKRFLKKLSAATSE